MNPLVELNLSLMLFLPWFLILAVLFWMLPRKPRPAARVVFDLTALAVSLAAFWYSMHWSVHSADTSYGKLWPQILATAVSYGVFLGVLSTAFALRAWWLRR